MRGARGPRESEVFARGRGNGEENKVLPEACYQENKALNKSKVKKNEKRPE